MESIRSPQSEIQKRFRLWPFYLTFIFAMTVLPAAFDNLIPPRVIQSESGSIVVRNANGSPRWAADWTMAPSTADGGPAVRFTETGGGRYSGFTQDVRWSIEAVWKAAGKFTPLTSEKTVTDTKGALLSSEKKTFEPGKSTVRIERRSASGRIDRRSLNVPPDTLTVEGIAGVLRSLPFDQKPFATHFLTNEPRLYDITIEPRGKERVRTPAGEFECYKLEMVPHMGVLNIFKGFFPKTYFWFTVAPPHYWVRYEGLENGQGTPQIIMELKGQSAPIAGTKSQ